MLYCDVDFVVKEGAGCGNEAGECLAAPPALPVFIGVSSIENLLSCKKKEPGEFNPINFQRCIFATLLKFNSNACTNDPNHFSLEYKSSSPTRQPFS